MQLPPVTSPYNFPLSRTRTCPICSQPGPFIPGHVPKAPELSPPFSEIPRYGKECFKEVLSSTKTFGAKQAKLSGPGGRPNSSLLPHSGKESQESCPPLLQLTNLPCASAALAGRTWRGTGRWRRCWRRSFSPPPPGLSSHFWLLSSTLYRTPGRKQG